MIQLARNRRIALFMPTLHCGGAERSMVNLLHGMAGANVPLDLILVRAKGPLLAEVPPQVRVIDLRASQMRYGIWRLANYLRRERPHAVLSRMNYANLAAIAARQLARVNVRIVVVEASNASAQAAERRQHRLIEPLMRLLYPRADAIVAVSDGVAQDLRSRLGLARQRVQVIYNPVADRVGRLADASQSVHPWLHDGSIPVFLSVGRLAAVKDFSTLIQAFAMVLRTRPARLLILGEGDERGRLESLRDALGIGDHVAMPGYSSNPYPSMRRAAAYVLSSRYEGLPNALIEALVCGCPVVSTRCPSGPAEILADGTYGHLVPLGDVPALAAAMHSAVEHNWNRELLRRRGCEFSLSHALPRYLEALDYPHSGPGAEAA